MSRRTFVGLALGALAGLLTACRGTTAVPTGAPTAASLATVRPTEAPPAATHISTPPAAPTSTAPAAAGALTPPSPPPTPSSIPASGTPLPATYSPVPATPTLPPPPTATPVPVPDRAALVAHWPATAVSRVVAVRHSGAWAGEAPDPAVVVEMLDEGLRTLTDLPDSLTVWRALFGAQERVVLKVNCIAYGGPTQPAVAYAVAQRLQDAGLRAENLLIFDRTDGELEAAGYRLNQGGAGVQCHGARGEGTEASLSQATVRFYQEIDACDALVNLPIPKQHGTAGISVALKNHYGSVNRPGSLHGGRCDPAIAELNAQPAIRDKTRLVVGAALEVSPNDWNRPERENALLLSFDPVALDTVARDILVRHRQTQGQSAGSLVEGARHLRTAQTLGLGATESHLIDLREVTLA